MGRMSKKGPHIRAALRLPNNTSRLIGPNWGWGELGPGQKAFNSITQIGVLSSLVLAGFDPLWPSLPNRLA